MSPTDLLNFKCPICKRKIDSAKPNVYIHTWDSKSKVLSYSYFHVECWSDYAGENWFDEMKSFSD